MTRKAGFFYLNGLLVAALLGAGCGEDAQVVARQVRDFIQNVQTGDGQARGALVQGAAPEASGGPTPSSNIGSANIITGGTVPIVISSDVQFASIIVLVGGAEDYYEIDLPAPTGSAELLLTFGDDIPRSNFDCVYTVITTGGQVGQYISTAVTAREVESGDVQVTVTWDSPSDVDLAVVGPDEERISFSNPEGQNGASLTVDSNAGCNIDNINTESITYPTGDAPSGTYVVEVRLFSGCTTISTNFTVTVLREGTEVPIIQRGSFGSGVETPTTGGAGGVDAPTTGQQGSNLFTFTFEFPPRSTECPAGQVFDEELGRCVPEANECPARDLAGIGTSCETPGQPCTDARFVCGSNNICTVTCDLTCDSTDCPESQPVCAQDTAVGEPVCGQGAVIEQGAAYEACGVTGEPATCESPGRCLGLSGMEAIAKPFCSPPCADNACPAFESVAGVCGLGEDGSQTPTRCILVCNPSDPACPEGMTCQAVQESGVCIWPLTSSPSP